MRSQDMRLGETYVLRGHYETKVTLLQTPPELRRQGRVRVRFESGVKAGEIGELLSRRIAPPLEDIQEPATPYRPRRRRLTVVERNPEVGDTVTWSATAGLVWTLESLDEQTCLATIVGSIFGQPASRVVPIGQLQVHVDELELPIPVEISLLDAPPSAPESSQHSRRPQTREHLRPVKPRRALDEMLDDVLFSPSCVQAYKQRYARNASPTAANELLREEIRRAGFIMDGGVRGSDEYARLRVPHRFDVVLNAHPTVEQPITVNGLYFPAGSKAGKRHRRRQRRRAA
jgi:hypothetical protein